jgi:hypothetical protein
LFRWRIGAKCGASHAGPDPDIYNVKVGFERLDAAGSVCGIRWIWNCSATRAVLCSRYRSSTVHTNCPVMSFAVSPASRDGSCR